MSLAFKMSVKSMKKQLSFVAKAFNNRTELTESEYTKLSSLIDELEPKFLLSAYNEFKNVKFLSAVLMQKCIQNGLMN
jgi:hypothetical protein